MKYTKTPCKPHHYNNIFFSVHTKDYWEEGRGGVGKGGAEDKPVERCN